MLMASTSTYRSDERRSKRGDGWISGVSQEKATRKGEQIVAVKYFTSMDEPHPWKIPRQVEVWWKALRFSNVEVFVGKYEHHDDPMPRWVEKQTDGNLAFELGHDAAQRRTDQFGFDAAIILSGDGDFCGPACRLRKLHPEKRVVVMLPPGQPGTSFRQAEFETVDITLDDLKRLSASPGRAWT